MSERMTGVYPRRQEANVPGFENYGRKARPEMIEAYRRHYAYQLKVAERALALADEDLIVETYLGSWARQNRQEVTS